MNNKSPISDLYQKVLLEISKAIVGKGDIEQALIIALISGGHVLIQGPSGTAKTKVAQTFAEVVGGSFRRIQCTPDMMPSDITGFYVYSTDGTPRFIEGPIFAHVVLADELNRTTPRTQSALLEAMQECQVTVEGRGFALAKPFMVIATQVPSGAEGTYPLTEVQIDRFLLMVKSEHPSKEEEKKIVSNIDQIDEPDVKSVTDLATIQELQQWAKKVHVSPDIIEYITSIVAMVRSDPDVLWGPSPRASISLFKCSRVLALLNGRSHVIPDDIKSLCHKAVEHRFMVKPEAETDGVTPGAIVARSFERIPVPRFSA